MSINGMHRKRKGQDCTTPKDITLFERGLIILVLLFSTFKLFLAIEASPFGYGQCPAPIRFGAVLAGYTSQSLIRSEIEPFLVPYFASVLLRLGFPHGSILFLNVFSNIVTSVIVFLLVRDLFDRRTALIAFSLTGLNWFLTFYSYFLLIPESILTLFATTFLFFLCKKTKGYQRRRTLWFLGILVGMAILAHEGGFALIGVIISFFFLFRKDCSKLDLLSFLITLSLTLMFLSSFRIWTNLGPPARARALTNPGIAHPVFVIKELLVAIPYQVSIPTLVFFLFGAFSLVRDLTKYRVLIIAWMISFLGFYFMAYSLNVSSMRDYCSINWLVPVFITAAVGMNKFIQSDRSPAATLLVFFSILSVSVEGPVPFLSLESSFPFLTFKNSLKPYIKIVSMSRPLNESNLILLRELNRHFPIISIKLVDIMFLASLVIPIIIDYVVQRFQHYQKED